MDAPHPSTDAADAPACPGCEQRDRRIAQLQKQIAQLDDRIRALEEQLAAGLRSAKRQAAPFSKGPPKADPKPPGRKSGDDYGTKAHRLIPPVIDEVYDVPAPTRCPDCSGHVAAVRIERQYQVEVPRRPIGRQFNIGVGECVECGRIVRGRHPLQTSDATGCCASQLGPDAQALIVHLNKEAGLSHGKIAKLLGTVFGIAITRGGVCQSMLRTAGKCLPAYHAIIRYLATSDCIVPDETGWRIGGGPAWLHAFPSPQVVAYLIARERGFLASSRIIPPDYAGTLVHDGWAPYERFTEATHQTCNAHLLRRCHEMLEVARGGAVFFPRKVQAILQKGLAVRDRRDAGQIVAKTAAAKADELQSRLVDLIVSPKANEANERLAEHLYKQQESLFTYLRLPGIDATNWRGEQAIRPAVVNRKVWGGNRTEDGAAAQGILMSVWQTALKQGKDALGWVSRLLCSPATAQSPLPAGSG